MNKRQLIFLLAGIFLAICVAATAFFFLFPSDEPSGAPSDEDGAASSGAPGSAQSETDMPALSEADPTPENSDPSLPEEPDNTAPEEALPPPTQEDAPPEEDPPSSSETPDPEPPKEPDTTAPEQPDPVLPEDPEPAESFAAQLPEAEYADGIAVVSVSGTGGTFSYHRKDENGLWEQIFSTSCLIGRNGQGKTAEGDGKTPTGTFPLGLVFGTAANPGSAVSYLQVDPSYYWVDDSSSAHYNRLVSTNSVTPDWSSAEHLCSIPGYDYIINVEYNPSCTPGLGSAIFIHCSTGETTGGCIAISRDHMVTLLQNLSPNSVIVIG